jgi:hypothetical protein
MTMGGIPERSREDPHSTETSRLPHCIANGTKKRMSSSGMLRRLALVKADVSEELSASIIRGSRISER